MIKNKLLKDRCWMQMSWLPWGFDLKNQSQLVYVKVFTFSIAVACVWGFADFYPVMVDPGGCCEITVLFSEYIAD